jgi:hypothetical protein
MAGQIRVGRVLPMTTAIRWLAGNASRLAASALATGLRETLNQSAEAPCHLAGDHLDERSAVIGEHDMHGSLIADRN